MHKSTCHSCCCQGSSLVKGSHIWNLFFLSVSSECQHSGPQWSGLADWLWCRLQLRKVLEVMWAETASVDFRLLGGFSKSLNTSSLWIWWIKCSYEQALPFSLLCSCQSCTARLAEEDQLYASSTLVRLYTELCATCISLCQSQLTSCTYNPCIPCFLEDATIRSSKPESCIKDYKWIAAITSDTSDDSLK